MSPSGRSIALLMLLMAGMGGLGAWGVNAVDAHPSVAALVYFGVAALGGVLASQLVLRASRRDPDS
jgi:hypothetical protein